MTRIDKGIDISAGRSELSTFLMVLGLVFAGFFIGQFVSFLVATLFALTNGASQEMLAEDPSIIYEYMSLGQVMSSQMLYTLVFTFLTPFIYLRAVAQKPIAVISNEKGVKPALVLITFIGTFCFIFLNAYFIEWNANVKFPEFMSGFEKWARETEDQLAESTERFTTFNNFGQFLFGFLVIAILPGIGEEFLFRGLLQNSLHKWSKNAHIAIWGSAFLFAAIHLQFYGLVPRMMLGAVFGYLYVWSGNIWYPIISHIANNGIGVIAVYYAQLNESAPNLDDTNSFPVGLQIGGSLIFIAAMFLFRNHYIRPKQSLE